MAERYFWFGLGMLVMSVVHLITTTTPAQVADNARVWLVWAGF